VNASDNFTISVTSASGTPTGSVTLTVDSNAPITETLAANGTYVYTTSFTTTGAHTIVAAYAGNSTYAASTGTVTINVGAVSSGTGTISLAASPTTLSVAQGATGTETITVTPAGGYTGTVLLAFDTSNDTALQNLCYEFTNMNSSGEGTVTVAGTAAAATQLTLFTNASQCAATGAQRGSGIQPFRALRGSGNSARNTGTNPAPRGPVPLGVAFAGLLLAGFLGRYARRFRSLAALIALAAVGLAVTACGGGVVNTALTNPPAGTYTITVTGQDSATASVTASTHFTFTIQ
jgi:hypothetical protein